MRKVLLDTNFILTCVKQKIDFFEELRSMGMEILIPKQVLRELCNMKSPNAELALKILDKNKFEQVDLKVKNVDEAIIEYAEKNKDIFVGTLDREIKKKTENSKVVIREKKRLEVI